jgi:solute carrier family 13 (sodium-dependent dicarboxylate transporter), member 2/3/5
MNQWIKIISGPALGIATWAIFEAVQPEAMVSAMGLVTIWMAVWWITEAVPLAVTSLLPVFLFPLLGIMSTSAVAPVYMNEVLMLFIGGFILAFAMEKWDLHRRIALRIILLIGTDLKMVLLGLMVATYLLSMWISNTATTMMMVPTTLAVVAKMHDLLGDRARPVAKAFLLGIAYAASIGGLATLIGTPTNMIFVAQFENAFPDMEQVSFLQWFAYGLPLSALMLGACYGILRFMHKIPSLENPAESLGIFKSEYASLGKMTFEQKMVSIVFSLTAVLWFTRAGADFGTFSVLGWSSLPIFKGKEYFQDGTVAVAMASLLFIIPSKSSPKSMLMDWKTVQKLPLSIILLFGGGFALAKGFADSGLANWLAGEISFLSAMPMWAMIFFICVLVTVLSEFASNVATVTLVLPILAAIAIGAGMNPLYLMLPATFAASLGFMLPVATAPNTIVFGSEMITAKEMARAGFLLDLAGAVLITGTMLLFGHFVFGI